LILPFIPTVVPQNESKGDITFQPNVIPELKITFVEEFFRFMWKSNRFDLKLLIVYNDTKGMKELSLRDFWEKTDKVLKWKEIINNATDSMYEFGYDITDIPQEIADNVEYLIWKIEDANFNETEIEVEIIQPSEEFYNITRFHLPDNLVLSYEDLWLYNFTVAHPNKLETKVEGVKGKTSWNLDPITFSSNIITAVGETGKGDTEENAYDFEDLWDADKAGTLILEPSAFYNTSQEIYLDQDVRPADNKGLRVYFNVTQITGSIEVNILGKDVDGGNIGDNFVINTVATYSTNEWFSSIPSASLYGIDLVIGGGENCTLEVYQGQWGVVWKTGDTQFMFDCKIVLGDGSTETWFIDSNKQVTLNDGIVTGNSQYLIEGKRYSNMRFGVLEDATNKITSSGVSFISLEDTYTFIRFIYSSSSSGGTTSIYSCSFNAPYKEHYTETNLATDKIYHTMYVKNSLPFDASNGDFYDILVQNARIGIHATGTMDKIWIEDCTYGIFSRFSPSCNMSNVVVKGTYSYLIYLYSKSTNPVYLTNVEADSWTILWGGTSTVPLWRQYEFDLTVTYPNGTAINGTATGARATIQHYGQGGAVDYNATIGSDGTIPTQTLNKGFYNQTGANSIYSYEPFNLQISNVTGYDNYSKNFTLSQQTDWTIALQTETAAVTYTSAILVGVAFLIIPIGAILFFLWRKS